MSVAVDLAKSALEFMRDASERNRAPRMIASREIVGTARMTEAVRIAIHEIVRAVDARYGPVASEDGVSLAVDGLHEVEKLWLDGWASARPELDRYVDVGIVDFVRSVRHKSRHVTDDVFMQVMLWQR